MLRLLQNILIILLGTAAVVYAYQTFYKPKPCTTPVTYSIGTLDSRFGISKDALVTDLATAGGIWDKAFGRTLFMYDPNSKLTVSLMYDTRQQITQTEIKTKADISETKQTATSAKEAYLDSRARYNRAQKEYTTTLATVTHDQDLYNTKVEYWNARGGAPPAEYKALEDEKASLKSEQDATDAQRVMVNKLATDTNALIEKYNGLVDDVNAKVHMINSDGLSGTQFEEGVYISDEKGKRIEIYQFDNQTTFIRVLAHEMGHALGLAHNDNAESIMSPVNSGKNLTATQDDKAELTALCNL